jgi:predicted alpha/beta hydrolase family esterase
MRATYVTLPGIGGSGDPHWQTLWERADRCRRGVGGNRRVALSPADLNAKTGG